MKRSRRNRNLIVIRALRTRVSNLMRANADLRERLAKGLTPQHELEAALSRATAQLMGPLAPDHVDNDEPRDTRMFPWDPR